MLKLIYGPPGSGKTTAILQSLRKDLASGRSCILLVPEQQVVQTERKVAMTLRGAEGLRIEVLSFRRLGNRLFREYGGLCERYLDEGGQTLLLWQVLTALSPRLREYGGAELRDRALLELLLRQLQGIRRAAVAPARLLAAAEEAALQGEAHAGLRRKLQDLGLLQSGYEAALQGIFADPEGDLPRACDLLDAEGGAFFADKTVFLDGFSDLTGQEYALLERIVRSAQEVSFAVNKRPEDRREMLTKVNDCVRRLRAVADRAGVQSFVTVLPERHTRPALLRQVEQNLYADDGGNACLPVEEGDLFLSILSCATPYEEVGALAEAILRDVQEGGHFRDHAVAVRDVGLYAGLIESVFDACGIPVFLSRRGKPTEQAAVRAIFSAVEIVRGGWQTEEVLRYIKTGFAGRGLSAEDGLRFEQYVRSWGIRGRRFYAEGGFTMNPAGFSEDFSEASLQLLQQLNAYRESVVAPLVHLQEAFAGGSNRHTAAELTEQLYRFLCEIGMKDSLKDEAAEARQNGRNGDAERLAQLWNLICEVLDTLHEAAGSLPCGVSLYGQLLQTAFAAKDLGSIPTSLDEVTVSDALLLRGEQIRTLHMLGVNEGVFPAQPVSNGVFSDPDLELLRQLQPPIDLPGDSLDLALEEQYIFYSCAAMPKERLRISYSRSDLKGNERKPSDAVAQIVSITGIRPVAYETLPPEDRIYSRRAALEAAAEADLQKSPPDEREALRQLCADVSLSGQLSVGSEQIGAENANFRYKEAVQLSPSALDTFVRCPMSYHLLYTLRLSEERSAEPGASDRGTILHLLLERFLRRMQADGRLDAVSEATPITDEEIATFTEATLREYAETVCGGSEPAEKLVRLLRQTRRLGILLLQDLRDEFSESGFRPVLFELPIGGSSGGKKDPDGIRLSDMEIPLPSGGKVKVRGNIDRVDAFRDGETCYLRVVDYKTYEKKLQSGDPEKRKNLQMLIYLLALCREGQPELRERLSLAPADKLCPAGTLYYIAKQPTLEWSPAESRESLQARAKESLQRSGLVLQQEEVIRAMDPEKKFRYLSKKGLLEPAEFEAVLERTKAALCEVAEEIRSGKADAAPLKGEEDGCQYCPMNPICRRRYQAGEGEPAEDPSSDRDRPEKG